MMKRQTFFTIFCILVIFTNQIYAYSSGAPESVCHSMLPRHPGGGGIITPQISFPPYRIELGTNLLGQGQPLIVNIQPIEPEGTFAAFMIQARNRDPPYEIVGQFNSRNNENVKYMNCDGPQSSLTHTSPSPKRELNLEWEAPIDFLGDVVFNSTVAQSYTTFWTGIESPVVKIVKRELAPATSSIGISTTRPPITSTIPVFVPDVIPLSNEPTHPIYENCGSTKTCFGFPNGCLDSRSCKGIVAVTVKGETYEFEMKTEPNVATKWIAVGLSEDNIMGEDLVIECIQQNGRIMAYTSYNIPRPNLNASRSDVPQNSIQLSNGIYSNGSIYCKVIKGAVTVVRGKRFDLKNNQYNLLLASGENFDAYGVKYHFSNRLASANSINLSVVGNLGGSSTLLLRLHGAFMIVAWIGTTSIGILMARYFKQTWVGSQLCGKDLWFAWHRIFMICTWGLTIAAFVIIFVELKGWSAERNPHAILGVITTAICFFQPIGALFRPAPNSKNRPYFNWGHWLGGNVAHILAIVTIFFSVKLTKAELPDWLDWVLVAYVAFHVVMHLIFSISGCASERQKQRVNSFPMSDMSQSRNHVIIEKKGEAPFGKFRKGLLCLYILIIVLFVIALVVIVALAPIEETYRSLKSKVMDSN